MFLFSAGLGLNALVGLGAVDVLDVEVLLAGEAALPWPGAPTPEDGHARLVSRSSSPGDRAG